MFVILFGISKVDIQTGQGCSGDERQLADSIVNAVSPGREIVKLQEGNETQEFWAALGGKAPYANTKILLEEVPSHSPRLFQCSNASGHFNVEEIFDFAQDVSTVKAVAMALSSHVGSH